MLILGINEGSHDAAVALLDGPNILYASHAERHSKIKNDHNLNPEIIKEVLSFGKPDIVSFYEKRLLKKTRLILKGGKKYTKNNFKLSDYDLFEERQFSHHESHAAAGYYTSPFDDAAIVVIDAIGEWNTSSIWVGQNREIKKVYSINYPFSFGLFYSAFTHLIGLIPGTDEYILMGMAAYGNYKKYYSKVNSYFESITKQKYNFHKGITDWDQNCNLEKEKFDIAAAVQKVYEDRLMEFMQFAKKKTNKSNLVFMGGCALNCSANTKLFDIYDNVWIMPSPGDSGSSLGAAALTYGSHINWQGPYLGTNIPGKYPVKKSIDDLVSKKISIVAVGRAEFGPRALGNRSVLADPRDPNIKDIVNKIKKREEFRPFAPVVLEQYADDWFEMPQKQSPYMQFAVKCKKPDIIPSVVHYDGTSRVQTVNKKQNTGLYNLLIKWYDITGVPVLLNTSLNIKNQPLLNNKTDLDMWNELYNDKP
jgi:carbamoyltransferase